MDVNELMYLINGAVFEVDKVLGSGFLEKVSKSRDKKICAIVFAINTHIQ